MAGTAGRDAVAGFCFADDLSDQGEMSDGGGGRPEGDVGQHELRVDEWAVGALFRDDGESRGYIPERHPRHSAVMPAIAATASRQLRLVGCRDEQRRNQRQAEKEQQQRGWGASHQVHRNNRQAGFGKGRVRLDSPTMPITDASRGQSA